jgi:predicted hydrolase (HD superfamily)
LEGWSCLRQWGDDNQRWQVTMILHHVDDDDDDDDG